MLITEGSIIKLVGPFFLAIYIRMPTINYSVTQSIDTLAVNLSASEALVMNINNPLIGASYFGLETIPDSNGVYTSASPKNTSGSFTLGTGVLGVVKDDYKMGAVVSPGSNVLTFVPAQAVTGSTLRTRGIAAPPVSSGFIGLLDTYSGAAVAYSVRLLSSTYAGPAIRVRRSSDNTEQNIGFDSSGNLDTASLLSFCGAGNGFVTTWYDQSGNGVNISTSIASQQPLIVQTGVVNLVNSKPAIKYGQINQFNKLVGVYPTPQPYLLTTLQSTYSVFNFWNFSNGLYPRLFTQNDNDGSLPNRFDYQQGMIPLFQNAGTSQIAQNVPNVIVNTINISLNTQYLNASYKISSTQTAFGIQNNSLIIYNGSAMSYIANQITHIAIGGALTGPGSVSEVGFFNMQECINYYTDNSANRIAIQTNINNYYGIY
jgi:hypothetical protein